MAIAGLEENVITPSTTFYCPGYGTFYGRAVQVPRAGGTAPSICATRIERVVQRVLLQRRRPPEDRSRSTSTRPTLGLTGKTGIDLPNENESLVPSTEWKQRTVQAAVVPGRDDFGRDRSGCRLRHADRARDDDLDGRQRRHAGDAAPRPRGRFGDGTGWQSEPPPAPRARLEHSARRTCRRFATACGWSSMPPARRAALASPAATSLARPGPHRSISLQNRGLAARQDGRPRSRLFRVLRAARQSADRRCRLRGARRARDDRRADREARHGDVLRQEGRAAAADAHRCRASRLTATGGSRTARRRSRPQAPGLEPQANDRPTPRPPHRLAAHRGARRAGLRLGWARSTA